MGWVSDFFMSMMNIMSDDLNFPDFSEMTRLMAAVQKCGGADHFDKLDAEEMAIYLRAQQWFGYQPQPPRIMEPAWFTQIDANWSETFGELEHRGPQHFMDMHTAYSELVAKSLQQLTTNTQSGQGRLTARSSSRMWYYLIFLAGGMYLPTPLAVETTFARLNPAGPGIVQVSISLDCFGEVSCIRECYWPPLGAIAILALQLWHVTQPVSAMIALQSWHVTRPVSAIIALRWRHITRPVSAIFALLHLQWISAVLLLTSTQYTDIHEYLKILFWMAGGQVAASYDARKGHSFTDVTDHIMFILRNQVADANGIIHVEGYWRVIRNCLLATFVQNSWKDHSALRQMSHFIEDIAYEKPTFLYPHMANAINAIREAVSQPRGAEVSLYNITHLDMAPGMSATVRRSDKPTYPATIPNLKKNSELAKFLTSWGVKEGSFIKVYAAMWNLWKINDYSSVVNAKLNDLDSVILASIYLKRSHARLMLGPGEAFTERTFISAVYGFIVNRVTTIPNICVGEGEDIPCWPMASMRITMDNFANAAFGDGAAYDLWVDCVVMDSETFQNRPQGAPWLMSYHDTQMSTHTSDQQAIIANVTSSLKTIHSAVTKLKPTTLDNEDQAAVIDLFEEFSNVRCWLLRSPILAVLLHLWLRQPGVQCDSRTADYS